MTIRFLVPIDRADVFPRLPQDNRASCSTYFSNIKNNLYNRENPGPTGIRWNMPTYTEFLRAFPVQSLRSLVVDLDIQHRYENITVHNATSISDVIANSSSVVPTEFWAKSYSEEYDKRNILAKLIYALNLYVSVYNKCIRKYAYDNAFYQTPVGLYPTDFICPTSGRTRWDDIYSGRSMLYIHTTELINFYSLWSSGASNSILHRTMFWCNIRETIDGYHRSNRRISSPRFLREGSNRVTTGPATVVEIDSNGLPVASVPVVTVNQGIYSRTNMTRRTGDLDSIVQLSLGVEYLRKRNDPKKKVPFALSELVSILEKNHIEIPENIQQDFFELALPHIIS